MILFSKYYKIPLLAFFVFAICLRMDAQNQRLVGEDTLFARTHFEINVTGTSSHISVHSSSGPNQPRSLFSPGAEAGVNLDFNFNRFFGLQIGVCAGLQNYIYATSALLNQNSTAAGYDAIGSEINYLSIPVEFICRDHIGKQVFLFAGAGLTARFYESFNGSGGPDSNAITSTNTSIYNETTASAPPVIIIGRIDLGILLQLPNNNLLKIGLGADYGNSAAYSATYSYHDFSGNNIGRGSYVANAAYIGLNIGYEFTRIREHK